MNKCPFIAIREIIRETRLDAEGKVIEQKETPAVELRECLGAECEVFDKSAGRCSLPVTVAASLQTTASEIRETRENTAATLIHVLRKADTTNELLGRLVEAVKETPAAEAAGGATSGDLSALLAPINEMKEALNINQAKFSDILELILEDQQKRALEAHAAQSAGPAAPAAVDLAPLQSSLAEMKEALNDSQAKFSDILELMLEEQQRKAAEGAKVAEALDQLTRKQEQLFTGLAQNLQPGAGAQEATKELRSELASMAGMIEQGMLKLADTENKRQAEIDGATKRMAELQQSMLTLLETSRNEQRAAVNDRRRQLADEHNEKGVMLYHRRESAAAEAEFRQALDVRPDFAEAYNNLGLALSDQNKKDEAVTAFKKALELLPNAPEAYNNLGCLYKIKKEYQQAVDYFNQAIAKRADYGPAYFNLGLAYEELEKFDLAIKAWEKVLALQPTHDEARRKIATYRARRT